MCTPDSLDKLNSLISQASDTISCDANCQQQRNADQLKQKYLDAQTNLASAPNQLSAAQKNYLVFTQGTAGYNDANESELQAKAQAIVDAFQQNFYDQEAAVNTQIDTYDGLRLNFENIFDLYKKYKVENNLLNVKNDKTPLFKMIDEIIASGSTSLSQIKTINPINPINDKSN